ncbi:IclR family transcriptional regulator [Maritimibacter fusiformis]|uniref:IclR family transcriptional regulator n=1 Tax=Maritimibacter fusiformis TaxID=2603819 RepID=A0A5D0RI47_9RHOB|nr:IclR family transcriptional regulator [Maritimibacter fusiformis]TYB81113.1 IclR family transcriptional regulator [Maritimibacter fusiformis]
MSVTRALNIVRAVAKAEGPLTPTEIAERIGVPRASVYRLIKSLEEENVLSRSADGATIEVTSAFLRTMIAGASTNQIIAGFQETLACTANTWGASAFLARLDGTSVEVVHSVAPCDTKSGYVHPGSGVRPAHACSASRAILAFLPEAKAAAIMGDDFEAFTDKTLVDKDAIQRELALTRERGYAICDEEIDPGITSIAAPVIVGRAGVVYSLGIVSFSKHIHTHGFPTVGEYLHAKAKGAVLNATQNLFEFAA